MQKPQLQPKLTNIKKLSMEKVKDSKIIINEVTNLVAEIVDAVAIGKNKLNEDIEIDSGIILNEIMRKKAEIKKQKAFQDEIKEQKRKERAAKLKEDLNDAKKEKLLKKQKEDELMYQFRIIK